MFTKKILTVDNIRYSYFDEGERDVLVLLHGFVANSFGGALALLVGARYPTKCRQLILLSPLLLSSHFHPILKLLIRVPTMIRYLSHRFFAERYLRICVHNPDILHREDVREDIDKTLSDIRADSQDARISILKNWSHNGKIHNRVKHNIEKAMQTLEKRTCIIWGKEDKLLPTEHHLSKIKQYCPTIPIKVNPSLGHVPYYEDPDLVAPMILEARN